jgi:hypothetical protein
VYNLTTFSSNHPGGIEALEAVAGTDGTESYEYAGHSANNMAEMQQYGIGRLAGSTVEQAPVTSPSTMPARSSQSRQTGLARWTMLAVAVSSVTSLAAAMAYQRRDVLVNHIAPVLNLSSLRLGATSGHNVSRAFWLGIAIPSSMSFVFFRYLYKLYTSTLDYENEVFSFPPTIPKMK